MGLNAVVTWPKEEWGFDPVGFAEMRPGAYDIHERVRDMNRNGVLASMCFPTFAGFNGSALSRTTRDKDLALVIVQAYNDWHIDEWCGGVPRPVHPARHPAGLGPAGDGRRDAPGRGEGLPRRHHARVAAHRRVCPSYTTSTTGTRSSAPCVEERRRDVPAHRAGLQRHQRPPDAPIDNLIILAHPGVGARRARPAVGCRAMHDYPDLKVASVGGRDRLDPLLPRPLRPSLHEPAVAGSRLRRQAAERHLPRALARRVTSPTRRR